MENHISIEIIIRTEFKCGHTLLRANGFDLETICSQTFNQDVDNTKLSIIHSFYFYLKIYLSKLKCHKAKEV